MRESHRDGRLTDAHGQRRLGLATGSYTRRRLTDDAADQSAPEPGEPAAADPGRPARPKLRRRPLGYRRGDVDEAFAARDAELAELRQDIAALWLAFAQHDRMIRTLGGEAPPPATEQPAPATAPERSAAPDSAERSTTEAEAESIGNQLSELDEVLAAIEMATKTLEHTYADEIGTSRAAAEDIADEGDGEGDGEAEAGSKPDEA